MATYTGSGKFVAITASNNGYDYVYPEGMHGITFGKNEDVYCTISPHYKLSGDTIVDTSLNIESGIFENASINMPLYIAFTNLQMLYLGSRSRSGYTGSIRVANNVSVDSHYMPTTIYKTYTFYCGILTNV